MEIVAIEAQTFDRMLQRLKDMARITDEICKMHGERKIGGWMDSQDACLRLRFPVPSASPGVHGFGERDDPGTDRP